MATTVPIGKLKQIDATRIRSRPFIFTNLLDLCYCSRRDTGAETVRCSDAYIICARFFPPLFFQCAKRNTGLPFENKIPQERIDSESTRWSQPRRQVDRKITIERIRLEDV